MTGFQTWEHTIRTFKIGLDFNYITSSFYNLEISGDFLNCINSNPSVNKSIRILGIKLVTFIYLVTTLVRITKVEVK